MKNEYNSKSIKSLNNLEAIQLRPGMYIGDLNKGIVHLVKEIVSNSIDEFLAGRNSNIININLIAKSESNYLKFIVCDNGSGIPLDKIEEVAVKTHSGGKFDSDAYKYSGGLHGVGLTTVNALSDICIIKSIRNNVLKSIEFRKGIKVNEINSNLVKSTNGTVVEWEPSLSIFKNYNFANDFNTIILDLHYLLYDMVNINNGVNIVFTVEIDGLIQPNLNLNLLYNDGIEGFFKRFTEKGVSDDLGNYKKIDLILKKNIKISSKTGIMELDAIFNFAKNTDKMESLQFVNGIPNISQKSKHIDALFIGVVETVLREMKNSNKIPRSLKSNITANSIKELFCAIILSKHVDPLFESQTKDNFSSEDYFIYAKRIVTEHMRIWIKNNQNDFDTISKMIVAIFQAKEKAKENKSLSIRNSNKISTLIDNMEGFSNCFTRNRDEAEVFFTEGVSAGGTISRVVNKSFQAVLKMTGKIPNAIKQSIPSLSANPILNLIVSILKVPIGKDKNYSNLQFGKIIIACDADIDGHHIISLLLTFFYVYYRELIFEGKIYLANPPLYGIFCGNKKIYIKDEESYKNLKLGLFHKYYLGYQNDKRLNNFVTKIYINKVIDFAQKIKRISDRLEIDVELLEVIILNLKTIMKKDFRKIEELGFKCKIKEPDKFYTVFEFDRNYEHYNIRIDDNFYNNVYSELSELFLDLAIKNVSFYDKLNNIFIGGSHYKNSLLINNILTNLLSKGGEKISMTRYKGLGEMDSSEILKTVVNPSTRRLTKVTMKELNNYVVDKQIKLFMSNDHISEKKKVMLNMS